MSSRAKKSGPHSRHKEAVSSQILIDFKFEINIWYDLELISDFISNFEIYQNFAWNRFNMSNMGSAFFRAAVLKDNMMN